MTLAAQALALPTAWRDLVAPYFEEAAGRSLAEFVDAERGLRRIHPADTFRALQLTPFAEARVVILGQDPYHGPGQAHGLAFSVPDGTRIPPSLRNIFVELQADLECAAPGTGNLEGWARQGVLLLNTVLTVEEGKPASHAGRGWESLTDRLVGALARDPAPRVFMLWGAHAQAKRGLIGDRHRILVANHPSPLSARRPPLPFIGCRHFSLANRWLQERGRGQIAWCR